MRRLKLLGLLIVLGGSLLSPLHHGTLQAASEPTERRADYTLDLGAIAPESSPVTRAVSLTNDTSVAFDVLGAVTSCGCTTAEVETGPLAPGASRDVRVTFDPATHPELRGPFTRMVYVATSDPDLPEIEIEVVGMIEEGAEPIPNPDEKRTAVAFYNEACSDCAIFMRDTYPRILADYGWDLERNDYIDDRSARERMRERHERLAIPIELQSHLEIFLDDKLVVGGHVPESALRWLLEHPDAYNRLLIFQDEMHTDAATYTLWDFEHEPTVVPVDTPIEQAIADLSSSEPQEGLPPTRGFWSLFGVISSSAFLDGLNPCAFAVLLFFIAFLFSIKRTRMGVWKMGLAYIFAVFLAYLLIGVGIAQAIVISGAPHLMAMIGSWLVIGLGVIQLAGLVFPRFPIRLRIPIDTKATLEKWMFKATLPAALIGGFLVGLCTFPCSGGIYVAIIGMLSAQRTFFSGLGWMVWYNLIFVLPLLILLAFAGNPKSAEKLAALERIEAKKTKVLIGLFMIALGAIILIFFT